MFYSLIAAAVGLGAGIALGYLVTYRYKAQYEIARRQLANLRGENFRGEVATIPFQTTPPQTNPTVSDPTHSSKEFVELQELRDRNRKLEEDLLEAQQAIRDEAQTVEADATEETATGTEQWQLQQLHREQIAMQLSLDEYQLQVQNLTSELETARSRAESDLLQLRTMLGEHEATIASLEREKSSLLDRLRSVEPPAEDG